jgi:murein DD-endopeptidase MepM/ murein hydrolase activator NlpD
MKIDTPLRTNVRFTSGLALATGVAAMLVVSVAWAQGPAAFPTLDMRVPAAPRPLAAGGATHLAYEIHLTNLSARSTTLDAVEVRDRTSARDAAPLMRLEGEALGHALRRLGAPRVDSDTRVLPGGRTSVLFVWVTLNSGLVPEALTHRFTFRMADLPDSEASRRTGSDPASEGTPFTIDGVEVPVASQRPRVVGPPLEGDHWLAANGPDNGTDHRRTLLSLAGQARIAQRFAVDWVRLYDDGRTFRGDPLKNTSYRAFGASVLAVADGIVVDVLDGIPENVPDPTARAVPITPETLVGNYVLLDIGGDACAVYAHLQPGSLRVKKGDHVRRGQTLARVGNTGNSSEPHLHFHMADRNSAIDSEGIPYAFASFDLEADPETITRALIPSGNSLAIREAGLAGWRTGEPQRRENEAPLLNAIVTFPRP